MRFDSPLAETCRNDRGSAMVETVVVMPIYLMLVFALIFFGHSTLAKQKQHQAAAYAAWLGGQGTRQDARDLLPAFFPWVAGQHARAAGSASEASVTVAYSDGSVYEEARLALAYRPDDERELYDQDEIDEGLFILALGERDQHFEWRNGQTEEVITTHWDDAANYLNPEHQAPPARNRYYDLAGDCVNALNGPGSSDRWAFRERTDLTYTYKPHYLGLFYAGPDEDIDRWGDEEFTRYAALEADRPASGIEYLSSFAVAARGGLERRGARDHTGNGSAIVLGEMRSLLTQPSMPPPYSASEDPGFARLKAAYPEWAASTNPLWVPR